MKKKLFFLLIIISNSIFAQFEDELLERGREELFRGSAKIGISILESLMKKYPKNSEAPYYLGLHYQGRYLLENNKQKLKLAEKYFLEAINRKPFFKDAFLQLADCNIYTKNYKIAKKYLDEAIFIDSTDAKIYEGYGSIYENTNDLDKAISYYTKAVELEPNERIYSSLGSLYFKLHQYGKAIQNYEYEFRNDEHPLCGYELAYSYLQIADTIRAKDVLDFAIEKDFASVMLYNLIAEVCYVQTDYNLSIKYSMESLNKNPKQSEPYALLSKAYGKLGNIEKQNIYFRKAELLKKGRR
ncbi:MAG: hypothetical protein A2499_08510 [Stygiobacter sp. RIFOXYC12_FULL_38_8]|nr:MAG: hypothetical protein A2X62_02810 [Stygiobacter sp. GWC2_38_9]OGV06491.1 MAG: hypothetical protein A2299_02180 [Stygiobacter sp. RIFOXYB2_FULL_37_11]OGV10567.1 MAG: hypothetical protein A2237_18715 [Stygiobacter sp. RIFOXYA2_FULL_38_8]OGV13248.1 MAG: hypothetical protein A2440_13040 [Stygiobacter sp. RIFOXYC2_FULL_38_25]OGV25755.1 MAG: hypothetical protein A2499_08510 [Stygiobacter sp. RIFOXYC12_FULL_38_8]OGV83294.1 MAG: hypothetical protein A2X65_16595 [Stygiobacter sp. GWF2_38_21]RJQ